MLDLGVCVLQVSGESAAEPAQPAGGAAQGPAAAAPPGRLRLLRRRTVSAIGCKNAENLKLTGRLTLFGFVRPSRVTKVKCFFVTTHAKHLQELLEAREQECVGLRRQLKELKSTASLRRLLAHSGGSSDLCQLTTFCWFDFPSSPRRWHSTDRFCRLAVLPSTSAPEPRPSPPQRKPAAAGGLLECRKRDESRLIKNLITGQSQASPRPQHSTCSLAAA